MIQLSSADIVQITLWVLIAFHHHLEHHLFKSWTLWNIGNATAATAKLSGRPDLAAASGLEHSSALGASRSGIRRAQDVRSNTSRMLEWSGDIQSVLERSLRQQISKERKDSSKGCPCSPASAVRRLRGLFGTVWGIMHALQDIGEAKSASLDVVAGPIGEALVATAIGIAAAIPAVLAYNFSPGAKLCEADLEYSPPISTSL